MHKNTINLHKNSESCTKTKESAQKLDWARLGRSITDVIDECEKAMTLADHHAWVKTAANGLGCGSSVLWQQMCSDWAQHILKPDEARKVIEPIEDKLT